MNTQRKGRAKTPLGDQGGTLTGLQFYLQPLPTSEQEQVTDRTIQLFCHTGPFIAHAHTWPAAEALRRQVRSVVFRRQTRDGVSTSQHTVNAWVGVGMGHLPAEASRPRSSPVCARIHSCSLTVPASGLCQRPHRAPAFVANQPVLTLGSNNTLGSHSWMARES